MNKLCQRLMNAELVRPKNPEQLWHLLHVMVLQKLIDYRRRERTKKRGGGKNQGDVALKGAHTQDPLGTGIQQVCDRAPSAAELVMVEEQKQRLLNELEDPTLRQIAIWKMEDRSNAEIADLLGLCVRTVERKLRIIRSLWWSENLE
jgi:DNA-directed RNA polymerase specialized sigma24 family protein